mmetsp:Transcript_11016/g.17680  ORF Transcript_11016/g.17680 Transcript_11016/m.17680 type:complete len:215 (-) Transcript_11016:845-1489(-)
MAMVPLVPGAGAGEGTSLPYVSRPPVARPCIVYLSHPGLSSHVRPPVAARLPPPGPPPAVTSLTACSSRCRSPCGKTFCTIWAIYTARKMSLPSSPWPHQAADIALQRLREDASGAWRNRSTSSTVSLPPPAATRGGTRRILRITELARAAQATGSLFRFYSTRPRCPTRRCWGCTGDRWIPPLQTACFWTRACSTPPLSFPTAPTRDVLPRKA